jgi:YidC/Oxa1 family membrane protein insertase
MISGLFHTFVFQPLYNGLVFFIDIVPGHDVGLAVIALTILVRIVIFPLSQRAIKTQMAMKAVTPEVEALKEKFKDDKEQLGRALLALYRERDIHPFASFGIILIQLPFLLGLYWVFLGDGLPAVNANVLYSFIPVPAMVNMNFLGSMDMGAAHNIVLATLAALTQVVYTRLSMGARAPRPAGEQSFSSDMARNFELQARYVLPLIIGIVSYTVAAAVPLYWVTSNLFMIAQEYLSGRRFRGTQG